MPRPMPTPTAGPRRRPRGQGPGTCTTSSFGVAMFTCAPDGAIGAAIEVETPADIAAAKPRAAVVSKIFFMGSYLVLGNARGLWAEPHEGSRGMPEWPLNKLGPACGKPKASLRTKPAAAQVLKDAV